MIDWIMFICQATGKGTEHKVNSDDYKVAHREEVESGNIIFKATRTGSGSLSGIGSPDKRKWVLKIYNKEKPRVLAIQEIKCKRVDDQWVESVWGARNFSFVQIEARGRSGGLLLVWDTNSFSVKQSVREDRFVAIIVSDDGMKFSKLDRFLISEEFKQMWGNLAAVALDRKLFDHCPIVLKDIDVDFEPRPFRSLDIWLNELDIEQVVAEAWAKPVTVNRLDYNQIKKYQEKAMRWELEAEARYLSEDELKAWMEARRLWIEKDGEG
ncbi:reverse transcriptase domain, reverse transcriptase zinc-binding domain protein [Tanacetum coccineum]